MFVVSVRGYGTASAIGTEGTLIGSANGIPDSSRNLSCDIGGADGTTVDVSSVTSFSALAAFLVASSASGISRAESATVGDIGGGGAAAAGIGGADGAAAAAACGGGAAATSLAAADRLASRRGCLALSAAAGLVAPNPFMFYLTY